MCGYVVFILNKTFITLVTININQISKNRILIDKISSYWCLSNYYFFHRTICYKYEFVSSETGVNTQTVEKFNSIFQHASEIKKRILTKMRAIFEAFMLLSKNQERFYGAVLKLIKVWFSLI